MITYTWYSYFLHFSATVELMAAHILEQAWVLLLLVVWDVMVMKQLYNLVPTTTTDNIPVHTVRTLESTAMVNNILCNSSHTATSTIFSLYNGSSGYQNAPNTTTIWKIQDKITHKNKQTKDIYCKKILASDSNQSMQVSVQEINYARNKNMLNSLLNVYIQKDVMYLEVNQTSTKNNERQCYNLRCCVVDKTRRQNKTWSSLLC